jgi:hypothetical protein
MMTPLRRISKLLLTGSFLVGALSATLQAQRRDSVTLTLRVIDSAGAAVRAADVLVSTRGGSTIARGQTDSVGRAKIAVARDTVPLELLVRRIGFKPYRLDLTLPATIGIVLADLPYALDTVSVDARGSVRHRNYFIDSTSIANSDRLIFDGWDLLRKLRPRIIEGPVPGICPGVEEVWVNGKWIPPETVVINDLVVAREPRISARARTHVFKMPEASPRITTMSALAMIRPEHIAELTFHDCFDYAIKGTHSMNAVFVVLKPGIGFDPAKGSYVVNSGKKEEP